MTKFFDVCNAVERRAPFISQLIKAAGLLSIGWLLSGPFMRDSSWGWFVGGLALLGAQLTLWRGMHAAAIQQGSALNR